MYFFTTSNICNVWEEDFGFDMNPPFTRQSCLMDKLSAYFRQKWNLHNMIHSVSYVVDYYIVFLYRKVYLF